MLGRFDPDIAALARGAIGRLRKAMPGAEQLVYDNAYSLVVGFGATERASEAVLSVATFPKKVVLCFLWGAELPDPDRLLRGSGRQVRNIRVENAKTLESPGVKRLIRAAIGASEKPFKRSGGTIQIRAISTRRRPRRAAAR
jgi:hypothetical protein